MEIYKDLSSPETKQFEELLNSQLSKNKIEEGKIIEGKITKITNKAFRNIESWQVLEEKYHKLKDVGKNNFYKKRIQFFELELKKSLSSLMLILMNLKNIT